ncbi:phosphotransferase [Mycobacterium sp. 050134]|uniref:phosphotransferase n=1 Tax=Mycobacterium sp. 050134 TaxID=3096111 RepID=UPI002EDAEAF8
MNGSSPTRAAWIELAAPWPRLFDWVEQLTGGRIVEWRRQARWRPAWFLTVEVGGHRRHLYARCQRDEAMPWTGTLSLRREFDIMRVLHQHGIAVAAPLGFCEEPEAILMEAVQGRDRFDARDEPATRDAVITDYVRRLASAHRLDPALFEAIGMSRPSSPREVGYMGFALSEKWYRAVKPGPQPVIEFVIGWLHRNVPTHRSAVSWIHFDAGQFLHVDGRVTALMDVEFSCLGDPLADLGAMRMRDTAQPIGDLTAAYAEYARERGCPIDRGVVNFHAVRFALLTAMLSAGTRADPPATFDLAQWQAWSLMSLTICLEIIAEEGGYRLDPPAALDYPPLRNDAVHRCAQRILDDILAGLSPDDYVAFRLCTVRDLLPGLHRAARASAVVEEIDRVEAQDLLGVPLAQWSDVDAQLEHFASSHQVEQEADIARLLSRRIRRQIDLIQPGMRDVRGFRVQPVDWSAIPTT